MSNLSDLMPAGASGKTIEAVATATIASKAPVILNSAGTVTPVAIDTVATNLGADSLFNGTNATSMMGGCYDSVTDTQVLIFRNDAVSNYWHVVIGVISGSTTVWGTPVQVKADSNTGSPACVCSIGGGKVIATYLDSSGYQYARCGTITAATKTIVFGVELTLYSTATTMTAQYLAYSSLRDATVCLVSRYDYAFVYRLTVSGTTITADLLENTGNNLRSGGAQIVNNPTTDVFMIASKDTSASNKFGVGRTFSLSASAFSMATVSLSFSSTVAGNLTLAYDTSIDRYVVTWQDSSANYVYYCVGIPGANTSSDIMTWGTATALVSSASIVYADYLSTSYNTAKDRVVTIYELDSDDKLYYSVGEVAASSVTWAASTAFSTSNNDYPVNYYDSTAERNIVAYYENSPQQGQVNVMTLAGDYPNLTATNFVGIADAAITSDATFVVTVGGGKFVIDGVSQDTVSLQEGATYTFDQAAGTNSTHPLRFSTTSDGTHGGGSEYTTGVTTNGTPGSAGAYTRIVVADSAPTLYYYCSAHSGMGGTANTPAFSATGTVVVQGGTVTGANAILPQAISFGSEAVYESATTTYQDATFDSNSNKVVIAYTDNGNSNYGTAIVGTVSGTSISYGTPVVFESASTEYISATFDSDSNKVVVAYRDSGNSDYGTAIVGTVSGTAISFGTAVVYNSGTTDYVSCTFDSNSNKVVIAYRDVGAGSPFPGTAIVGTVSGTAISYGTAVVFEAANSLHISTTFDSDANKVVISYQDEGNSQYGTGIVGTVSGTAISFGTAVVYEAAATEATGCGFDSNSNKVVIAYRDSPNSDRGTAIVGTVSGTSISYGTAVVYNSHGYTNYSSVTFDSNANKVVIAYQGGASPSGSASVGTVSGTAISFVTAVVFNSAHAPYTTSTFDSNSNKTVIAFQDDGNSSYGTGIVGTLGNEFTVGSKYYVTPAGSYSTVAGTPSVNAGLATSTTQLLLNGDS